MYRGTFNLTHGLISELHLVEIRRNSRQSLSY
jgi:hypothetical protein